MTDGYHERCCGLDVHKDTVVACLLTPEGKQTRTFRTTTPALRELVAWLQEEGCTHVAMESTGVYWKPIYNLLEATGMTTLLANPQKIKAIPGRKTDVKDAEWIATLLRRDMIPASFIPDRPQRELAELVRYRRSLIGERTREWNRIRKVLEGANIKLGSALSKVHSVSAQAMLRAFVAGVTDPAALAALADPRVRASREELEAALTSLVGEHQRFMLAEQLAHIDDLTGRIARLDAEIEERMRPFAPQIAALDAIPGIGITCAQEIIATISTDLSRFPSAKHLASWAKVAPGNRESAGKRLPGGTGRTKPYLRAVLVEAAHAAGHTRDSYLGAQYRRLAARIGKKKAAVAVAHSILVIVYHILRDGVVYEELGADFFAKRNPEATKKRAVAQLERLGYHVTLEPAA
jgi:transposase